MFNYATYLEAKGPLDARSLHQRVWDGFVEALASREGHELRVLEAGGGIGAMFRRVAAAGLDKDLVYTLVDIEAVNLQHFAAHHETWLEALGYQKDSVKVQGVWRSPKGHALRIETIHEDIHAFLERPQVAGMSDALIGQAFLDLFDLDRFMPKFLRLLKPAGLCYFPINFDGITSFLPPTEPSVDLLVESIYHKSMDDRSGRPEMRGRSQSGRHLMCVLADLPVHLLEIGSSDWIVFPKAGQYIDNDQAFLAHMLKFVAGELQKSNQITTDVARRWIAQREQQLQDRQLMMLVHQIDLLGRMH